MVKRLLIVEDEFLIRMLMADCLREAGFGVVEAGNGDQAITLMDQFETFDLLITDLRMPGHADGNDVATQAILRYPGLPIIYASGRFDSLRNAIRSCDAFLQKPYSMNALLAMAMRILDQVDRPVTNHTGSPVVGLDACARIAAKPAAAM